MINPWLNFDFEAAEKARKYVHALDEVAVSSYNQKTKNEKHRLQTHMLPEPWVGNLDAPVVVLQANPRASDSEVNPDWQPHQLQLEAARKTLYQEDMDFPLYWLDPRLSETEGAKWSQGNLKWLINEASFEQVANRILLIETHAYHSKNFDPKVNNLKSQEFTKYLLRESIKRNSLIIVLRQKNYWYSQVPELEEYVKTGEVFGVRNVQRAFLSPGNLGEGFDKILERL